MQPDQRIAGISLSCCCTSSWVQPEPIKSYPEISPQGPLCPSTHLKCKPSFSWGLLSRQHSPGKGVFSTCQEFLPALAFKCCKVKARPPWGGGGGVSSGRIRAAHPSFPFLCQLCPGVLQKQQGSLRKQSNALTSEQAHWKAPSRCLQLQMLLECTHGEDSKGGQKGWVGRPEQMCLE